MVNLNHLLFGELQTIIVYNVCFAKNSLFKQTQLLLNDVIAINLLLSQHESTKITRIYT